MPNRAQALPSLVTNCQRLIPEVSFAPADRFYWSPSVNCVYWNPKRINSDDGRWALLHEVAHAELCHITYSNDFGLLDLEVAAWERAKALALDFGLSTIDDNHIQDCLDTYREWLYARSTCPTCTLNGLQIDSGVYRCLNCLSSWQVSRSRFCRTYRKTSFSNNKDQT